MATRKGSNYIRIVTYRRTRSSAGMVLDSPPKAAMAARLTREFKDDGKERFGCFLLDAASHVIGFHLVGIGSMDASVVRPKEPSVPMMVRHRPPPQLL